ncbi:MAG: CotH kinase family protein [Lachnospiraceae bacterium]|nr:CotH kinase family protein [Lachnospiraceae bacterium]
MTRKKLVFVLTMALSSLLLASVLLAGPLSLPPKELILYDVHCNSPRIVKDDGSIEFADYLYIKNMTDHAYDLTGLFLSDEARDLTKYPLEGIVLESGESRMIRFDPSWNFGLNSSGRENIYLSDTEGEILFKYDPDMKPKQPAISAGSGFYEDDFDVTITAKGRHKIYYTLDGSAPDENAMLYDGPIHVYDRSNEPNTVVNHPNTVPYFSEEEIDETAVPKAFVLRAAAADEYGNFSEIATKTYFFGKIKPRVLSVVADREDLFGDYGILVTGKAYDEWMENGMEEDEPVPNFYQKGKDWEVPADVEYFEGSKSVFTQRCGLRLQGRTSRDYRLKNFQLRAKNRYSGQDVFAYDFFNDPCRSDGLILDDSFEEALFYSLVEDERVLSPKVTQGIALFINGEYWKDVYLRQRLDEKFFADHYGIDPKNLILLSESFADIGFWEEDREAYLALDDFAMTHDLSDPVQYEKICSMMDMDSYIDYLAINACIGNNDWGEFENDQVWHVREKDDSAYGDGRFRWILHDSDHIFDPSEDFQKNRFITESVLYANLMKNPEFRRQFSDRIRNLMETTFSNRRIASELETWDDAGKAEVTDFFDGRAEKMNALADALEQSTGEEP